MRPELDDFWSKLGATISVLIISTILTACDQEQPQSQSPHKKTYSANCASPLKNWGTEKDGLGHMSIVLSVFLMTDGTAVWNKFAVSNRKLSELMTEAGALQPMPRIVLQVSPSTKCERVDEVRTIMNSAALCNTSPSHCSEGWNPKEWPLTGGP